MESHFNSQTLAEMLRDLYLSERVGMLRLHSGEAENRFFFDRGLISYAECGEQGSDLGQRLVAECKISAGALEEAQANATQLGGLANALITRDLISKEALSGTVMEIIERAIDQVFMWDAGTAEFQDGQSLKGGLGGDVLSTFGFILNGIFRMQGFEAIHEAMLSLENQLSLKQPAPLPVEKLGLSAAQGYVLSRIDGSTTAKDLAAILPPEEEELATRLVYGLLVMGVVEYDPPVGQGAFRAASILRDHADQRALEEVQERTIRQAYAQMAEQAPHQVLGVVQGASKKTIERAYTEVKSLFSKDRILPRLRDRYRSELAVIESRLVEAYLRLSQPETGKSAGAELPAEEKQEGFGVDEMFVRVEIDKTRSKIEHDEASKMADSYYAQARKAVRDGDFHNAIQYGKLAISYIENDARFYFLLAECQARNPGQRWLHQAEQNYTKATELDPWNAEYFMTLGRFYRQQGLKLRAKKQFEQALKLSPNHREALQELKALA